MRIYGFRKGAIAALLAAMLVAGLGTAQPAKIQNSADIQLALQKLTVLGSVLYLAAHPDDENTAVLTYFSKGRKYRTAYLSLTRGDGGQNLIGPEKGAEIGIIRTQELLGARGFDGAEQYFTRAIDFGYSKTPEETFEFWDHEKVLSDVVRVIRTYRPDVIVTRFPPGGGGHGHHTASVELAREAFKAAADPKKFPEQLRTLRPWQSRRLFWNSFRSGQDAALMVDVGEYNPLLGASYSEIAAKGRSMHKTQGFGSSARRGSRNEFFGPIDGAPAVSDIFEGIDTTWNRVPGGRKIGATLEGILAAFDPRNPSKSIPALFEVNAELRKMERNDWTDIKRREIAGVIQSCAGLWLEAISDDYAVSPGDTVMVQVTAVNRSAHPFTLEKVSVTETAQTLPVDRLLSDNDPVTVGVAIRLPADLPISQPYWLRSPPSVGMFAQPDERLVGAAENPPSICVVVTLKSGGTVLDYPLPLLYRWTDRVDGELYRPFEIRPPITLTSESKVAVFTGNEPETITVVAKGHSPAVSGTIRLAGPPGWTIQPPSVPCSFAEKYAERKIVFTVTPPRSVSDAVLTAQAEVGGKTYKNSLVEISHPHIPRQTYFPPSTIRAVNLDMKRPSGTIGFVEGAGDEIPDCLRNLGYTVVSLDDAALENDNFSRFDAIITGIRAYNTRDRLLHTQPRLLEYVKKGGTLIVQYNVPTGLVTQDIGPYPFTIGGDRVCDETAAVTFSAPGHRLLTFPNKITPEDFKGWVQERGLYFASRWDKRYETVLSSHDTNEPDRPGGLLFARYGEGVFIYTGYAWFRQLPAGVPGAYRLFVNLISAGKYRGE